MPYKALVVGCGGQGALADAPGSGNEHKTISFAHALKEHPGFKLLGVIDQDEDKARNAAFTWGATYYSGGGRVHGFFDEMYQGDCVALVSTPDNAHYDILKQLAEYPLKLVICEKPLCANLYQAREITWLYRSRGIPLLVNYTRRFLPHYEALKRNFETGYYGKFLYARAAFNRGRIHSGSHAVDFFNWFGVDAEYHYISQENFRIWQLEMFFERHHWREERIGDQPVWPYYDKAMWHVVDNAYQFLEGREPLKCTGEDALKALENSYMEVKQDG